MNLPAFLDRCSAYCKRAKMSESRLSTILFTSGVTIGRLRAGRGVTVRVLERAEARLAGLEDGKKAREVLGAETAVAA